ncbi:MAG: glycosyltransferase family 4 protein [Thermoanaerobaculia bacterium]
MAYTIGIDARKVQDFGIGTYIRNLVAGLAEIDDENCYVLFTGSQGRDSFDGLPENFHIVVERSPVYSARELMALSWRLFRLRLDLYHATHYVLPLATPSRIVVTIHDIIHLLYPQFLPNRLAFFYAQRMMRRSLSGADRVIAVSENTRSDLTEYFGVEGSGVEVIYNGVDDAYRERLSEEDLDRWLRQLDVRRPYLLFVGNPKPHKNLDRVIRAYARACETAEIDAPLVCVGDRTAAQFKLRQRAQQLGVGDRVRLLGHVAQEALPALYQGASLFLYPTLYEGFGLPVVEAMASGTPVLTSNTSALKEIASGHAHLVDPLDTERMARAIVRLMTDHAYREKLAAKGLDRSRDFRWRLTAERTRQVYLDVLRTMGPPPYIGKRRNPCEEPRR